MYNLKKTLLFAALVMLFVAMASAAEVPDADGDAEEVVQKTTVLSQSDTTQKNTMPKIVDESSSKKIIKNNANNYNVKKDDPPKTVKSWTELNTTIESLKSEKGNQTIILDKGSYESEGTITWNNTELVLTIDGNGQTLNGMQKQAFIIKSNCVLVLKNITITNCTTTGSGGAIYNRGNLTLVESTLKDNNANSHGGAILNTGTLIVTNSSTLENNKAEKYGGAIFNQGMASRVKKYLLDE